MKEIALTHPGPYLRTGGLILLVAAVYFILGWMGIVATRYLETVSCAFWPAAGWGLFVALRWNGWGVAGVALGAFAVNFFFIGRVADPWIGVVMSCIICLGNAWEALYGRWLMRSFGILGRGHWLYVLSWYVPVIMAVCCVASAVGVAAQLGGGLVTIWSVGDAWFQWWAGDVLGVILFYPFYRHLIYA